MLLETVLASSMLLSTDGEITFKKEPLSKNYSYTTVQERNHRQSIVPESYTVRHHHRYYKSKQEVPQQVYYSKQGFRGILTLSHITTKGLQLEACYTGEVIRC
ncbi:hypothetical protein P4377_24405 [Bacillus thuringiensis]|nr:hypothetical protein [Bacillus thuringiensis]